MPTTAQTSTGTSHSAVMCRWLLFWEIMPGAKPQNPPPIAAASRCVRSTRRNSR